MNIIKKKQLILLVTLCGFVFCQEAVAQASADTEKQKKVYDTPWLMGVKTNLLSDAVVIPELGFEIQLGSHLSFDLDGWFTRTNILCKNEATKIYGYSPEIRWWFGDSIMQKGHFVGLHGNFLWYTLEWRQKDGSTLLYQNGKENEYAQIDAGSRSPAWTFGVNYGYSLALDKKAHWGLEFVIGLGYGKTTHNIGKWDDTHKAAWYYFDHESKSFFGITQLGVNLTYRFSLRRVSPSYYEK